MTAANLLRLIPDNISNLENIESRMTSISLKNEGKKTVAGASLTNVLS